MSLDFRKKNGVIEKIKQSEGGNLGSIFSFGGYCNRLAYLGVAVVQIVVLVVGIGAMISTGPQAPMTAIIPFLLAILVSAWIGLAATVRRIRDMGWPMLLTLIGCFFLPMFSLLLLFWPGQDNGPDTTVFSDDKPAKAKTPKEKGDSWMDRALAQAANGRSAAEPKTVASTPAPPRFSGAMAAAQGPRTEFGLRR